MKLLNAFSTNMLERFPATVRFYEISAVTARLCLMLDAEEAGAAEMLESAVGHADTVALFAEELKLPVPCNRTQVKLYPGQTAILGQYSGPRLPEGSTKLPKVASIKWLFVEVQSDA